MKRRNIVSKPIGRQAFKGIISPLLLAGSGMGATPEMMSSQYISSSVNTLSQDMTTPSLIQPCPMSVAEGQICDLFPLLPFCAKRKLKETDASCTALQSDKPECPLNENIKRICLSTDFNLYNQYGQFCNFKKVNGICLDELLTEESNAKSRDRDREVQNAFEAEQEAERKRREEERIKEEEEIGRQQLEIEREKEWVRTRGCKFYDTSIPQSAIDMAKARNVDWWTTSIPCQYAKVFKDLNPGDTARAGDKELKFLGWIPETNPAQNITPLRGNEIPFIPHNTLRR